MAHEWPRVSYEDWSETCDTLHAHTQLLGKLAVVFAPPEPELQHAALRLTARGWETSPLPAPDGSGVLVVALDLRTHEAVVEHSDGRTAHIPLAPNRSVGEVTRQVVQTIRGYVGAFKMDMRPQEVAWTEPLDEDELHTSYVPDQVAAYFAAATQAALVLAAFRAPYRGRPHRSTRGGGLSTWPRTCSPGCRPIRRPTISSCATPWTPRKSLSGGGRATPGTAKRRSTPTRTRARRLRVGVPVTGRSALGCDPRGIHPRLGRRYRQPGPARFCGDVRELGLSARLRRLLVGPEPGSERSRNAAARRVNRRTPVPAEDAAPPWPPECPSSRHCSTGPGQRWACAPDFRRRRERARFSRSPRSVGLNPSNYWYRVGARKAVAKTQDELASHRGCDGGRSGCIRCDLRDFVRQESGPSWR